MPDEPERAQPPASSAHPPAIPGWVKVLGVIALIGIVLALASLVLGIQHGPSMHGLP